MRTVDDGLIADAATLWPALRTVQTSISDVACAAISRRAAQWCARSYFAASLKGVILNKPILEKFFEATGPGRVGLSNTSITLTMKPHPHDDDAVLVEIDTTLVGVREAIIEALSLREYGWSEAVHPDVAASKEWLARGKAWLEADASDYPSATMALSGFVIDYDIAAAEVLRYGGRRLNLTTLDEAQDVLFETKPHASTELRATFFGIERRILAERTEAVARGEPVEPMRPFDDPQLDDIFGPWAETSH